MPVRSANPETDEVGRFNRLSASQANTWDDCPRLWYYQNKMRLKFPQTPPLFLGRAVEECVCRVLRESPAFITEDSEISMKTPLDDSGSPDLDKSTSWVGPKLKPLEKTEFPNTEADLEKWAIERGKFHFPNCWDSAVKEWESSPRKNGSVSDISYLEAEKMVISAIKLHMQEVISCKENEGGPNLQSWREGKRSYWPPPDGFPRIWELPHPSVETGKVSWTEAWEISRPWFVDPDAKSFVHTSVHPEEWFQGEYDLVYSWSGSIKIVDLKASVGKGDRSGNYLDQLKIYSWLWWETHERTETVESLEIWYLGASNIKNVEIPDDLALESLSLELKTLYDKILAEEIQKSDCLPQPSLLRIFEKGGKPAKISTNPDSRGRCVSCDYKGICEGSEYDIKLPLESRIERLGHPWKITPIGDIISRVSVSGTVIGLVGPNIQKDKSLELNFNLQDGYDRARVKNHRLGGPLDVTRSLSTNTRIVIKNGLPSIWRGQLNIELDAKSSISLAKKHEHYPVVDVETRVNIVGRVWSIDAFPNGADIHRWAFSIVDPTGSAASVAFKQFIPISAASISRGDDIAILNGEVGEWAGRPQIRIGPGTKVITLKNSTETPDF